MIRKILLTLVFSLLFCTLVYGATLVDVGVPNDDIYSGSLQDFLNDYREEVSGVYDLSIPELNTLVYLLENQSNGQEFDYVAVLANTEKYGKCHIVLLSEEPLHLNSRFHESTNNTYLEFAPTDGKLMALTVSMSGNLSYQYASGSTSGFSGFGGFGSVYTNRTTGKISVSNTYDLVFANYDIERFTITADDGQELSEGIFKNYEKYSLFTDTVLDPDIPNPTGLRATYDSDTGAVKITWTPHYYPEYAVKIQGNSKIECKSSGGILGGEESHDFTSSLNLEGPHLPIIGPKSSTGYYNTNTSVFDYSHLSGGSYYDVKFTRLQYILSYYTVNESGQTVMGGTTSITVDVGKGFTVVETDTEGNSVIEGFDKDGNPITSEEGSGSLFGWLKSILKWIQNISSLANSIFELLKSTVSVITNIPNLIFDKFKDTLLSIANIPNLLVTNLETLFKVLFLPSEDYFERRIERIREKLRTALPYEYYIEVLETIGRFVGDDPADITADFMGTTVTIVSFSYIKGVLPRFHSWVRGIFFFLLLVYYINNFYRIINNTSLFTAVFKGSFSKGGAEE